MDMQATVKSHSNFREHSVKTVLTIFSFFMATSIGANNAMLSSATTIAKVKRRTPRNQTETQVGEHASQPSRTRRAPVQGFQIEKEISKNEMMRNSFGENIISEISGFNPTSSKSGKREHWGSYITRKIYLVQLLFQHPLLVSFLSLTLGGIIVSKLVDFQTSKIPVISSSNEVSELRRRLSSLDEHIKSVVPNMLLQVDLVNKQVEKLGHSHKNLEVKYNGLTDRVDKLDDEMERASFRLGNIDDQLKQILGNQTEIEEDLKKFIISEINRRKEEGIDPVVTIEDVRIAAKKILEEEIARHAADDIAKPDFALSSSGGRVLRHSETINTKPASLTKFLGAFGLSSNLHPLAQKILEPGTKTPGLCLPLKGNNGSVDVALRTKIYVSEVSLEHIPKVRASAFYVCFLPPLHGAVFLSRVLLMTFQVLQKDSG